MTTFGVTPAGFILKRREDILKEMFEDLRKPENFGPDVDLSDFSPHGIYFGLFAGALAEKWEDGEDTYYSNTIDNSEGVNLDRQTALRGIKRDPAKRSVGVLKYFGAEGSEVPVAALAQNARGIKSQSTESETIPASGFIEVDAKSAETGADGLDVNFPPGDQNAIVTAIPGITSVTNDDPFLGGSDVEKDAALRARYKAIVGTSGNSAPVIQNDFNEIPDVVIALVVENELDIQVGELTPHSINAIIEGGTEQEIVTVFLKHKLTGIQTIGANTINVIDNQNIPRVYRYDRPDNIDVFVEIDVEIDTSQISIFDFTALYGPALKENTVKYIGGTFIPTNTVYAGAGVGVSIEAWKVVAAQEEVPFIIGDVIVRVGKAVLPTGFTVDILSKERANTDDTKIVLDIS